MNYFYEKTVSDLAKNTGGIAYSLQPEFYEEIFVPTLFKPAHKQISWSKINLYLQCQSCFYKDQILGLKRPSLDSNVARISNAVDKQLKKDFDLCRKNQTPHLIMVENDVNAVPFAHKLIYKWREPYGKNSGIRFFDRDLNMELFGVVDDVWINPDGELVIVEYKTTLRKEPVTFLDPKNRWHNLNTMQVAFYAWLFKKNHYKVSSTGYFIFCSDIKNKSTLNQRLEFESNLISYQIDDSWVPDLIREAIACLNQAKTPMPALDCKFCGNNR